MEKQNISRRNLLKWSLTGGSLAALGVFYWPRRWKYITIHHSAGNYGNIEFLQKVHRQRQANDPIDAIPYHFVIGNGNGMKMGEIASDWRKENDLWGAHVSGNNSDRNFRGLGICLIGNFQNDSVPEPQYLSLLELTRRLVNEYNIPLDNISGHGHINGERTLCPGKNFPMERLLKDLRKQV
ncbi:peptidoglycan recognition protein family protein [Aliikangiella coralliicola]|uniref:N-acetylmuramoyl-L-alanine amidase n=1 Tax=Aliikangiella coralliicola TaxID=2592383 RepID=A0A545TSS7_9GAMM|nr:peptidoglycan recognition family protein [Aliikangiella coralliicola]TQV80268.1 N-acetylmuramoyl-L-alanine amidase [Aliikangiella coralliicola]